MKHFSKLIGGLVLCATLVQPLSATAANDAVAPQAESPATLYGIGSVSKVFTAAAVMQLVDAGKIDLDQPLTQYIPEFQMADARYTQITPRMLLNHSVGFMGMTDNNAQLFGDNDTANHDNFLNALQSQTLKHAPGETSIYCNDSFTVAEILVEHVSGLSFTNYLAQHFFAPMGLENIKTPQSNFDRSQLAPVYINGSLMQPENLNEIGSGGIYASMEDLCRYATIFMHSSDGSVLSAASATEMAKNQHQNALVSPNADTTARYGLGWDSVNTYPFNQYGLQALSKGGSTGNYHTNLTVLPACDLAVAVSSSGKDSKEQEIAQEIILAVLREEGLLDDTTLTLPTPDTTVAPIPASLQQYAGLYDMGQGYLLRVAFTEDALTLTPIGVRNERAQTYVYNADGVFVSTNGDYVGPGALSTAQGGTRGITTLTFSNNKYLMLQTYESAPGLSQTAYAMPAAEKVAELEPSADMLDAWQARNEKDYLLVSEKYSSAQYLGAALAKIHSDTRTPGYVGVGIYQGSGKSIKSAQMISETLAMPYQSAPTMIGRDTNILRIDTTAGGETLCINQYRYVDAASIADSTQIGDTVQLDTNGALWFNLAAQNFGETWRIAVPENGAWFLYDEKMNIVASTLEQTPRENVTLPRGGRIAFVGDPQASFSITK